MSKKLSIVEELKYIRMTSDIKKIYQQLGEEKAIEYMNNLSEEQLRILSEKEKIPGSGAAADRVFNYFRRLIGLEQPKNFTPRPDKPLEGEILSPPKEGEAATQMKDISPKAGTASTSLTTVDKVSDAPSFSKKDALKTGAGIAAGTGVVYGVNKLADTDKSQATDSGVPPQDQLGGSSPGTTADVSGTEFKPEKKEDYPTSRVSDKAPKFQFTDAEKQGKVSKERLKQWADTVGIEGDVSWKDYGRNFMNMAKGKEGQTLTMKNAPKPTEKQTTAEKKVKSYLSVSESLLAAFNEVVSSKHPNLFAEASKKGSVPKTEKEKSLAALAEPKDKITHKDVLVGRGVVKENELGEGITIVDTSPPKSGSVGEVPTQQVQTVKVKKPIEKPFVDKVMSDPNMTSPKRMGPAQTFEEVDFSEAELAHIASIVEAMAIAPTPDEQAPSGGIKKKAEGSKSGTLSDEYVDTNNKKSATHKIQFPGDSKTYDAIGKDKDDLSDFNTTMANMAKQPETINFPGDSKTYYRDPQTGDYSAQRDSRSAKEPTDSSSSAGPKSIQFPGSATTYTRNASGEYEAPTPKPMTPSTTKATAEPAPYGTGSDGKPYQSSIYPDNPLEDAEKALEKVKKLSSGALYKPTAKLSNASIKKVFEDHDVVIGKGTVTQIDPKTGKKVDYISPVTLNNPHMQGSKDEFKMPNPVPLPPKRPKELLDLKYKKMATDADIEAIKKDLVKEAKNQEDNEPVATGANKLHVNAKKAADYNTPNVKHKFENGEEVILTRGMAGDFLARHRQAKTADDKDAILKHANKSLDAFKSIARGGKVPSEPKASAKPKISLGSMKGK